MLSDFLILISHMREVLLGPQSARHKLCNCAVNLDILSVKLGPAVKDLDVIINSCLSFESCADNITKMAFLHIKTIP